MTTAEFNALESGTCVAQLGYGTKRPQTYTYEIQSVIEVYNDRCATAYVRRVCWTPERGGYIYYKDTRIKVLSPARCQVVTEHRGVAL